MWIYSHANSLESNVADVCHLSTTTFMMMYRLWRKYNITNTWYLKLCVYIFVVGGACIHRADTMHFLFHVFWSHCFLHAHIMTSTERMGFSMIDKMELVFFVCFFEFRLQKHDRICNQRNRNLSILQLWSLPKNNWTILHKRKCSLNLSVGVLLREEGLGTRLGVLQLLTWF